MPPVHRRQLPGLTALVIEDHHAHRLQHHLVPRRHPGRTQEPDGHRPFLEHMMFKGTPSLSQGRIDAISLRRERQQQCLHFI